MTFSQVSPHDSSLQSYDHKIRNKFLLQAWAVSFMVDIGADQLNGACTCTLCLTASLHLVAEELQASSFVSYRFLQFSSSLAESLLFKKPWLLIFIYLKDRYVARDVFYLPVHFLNFCNSGSYKKPKPRSRSSIHVFHVGGCDRSI